MLTKAKPRELYELLRAAIIPRKIKDVPTAMGGSASQEPKWRGSEELSVHVTFRKQIFHVQLELVQHEQSQAFGVMMLSRWVEPRTSASQNTQRATFNSRQCDAFGYYLSPTLPKGAVYYDAAFAASLPDHRGFPRWRASRIQLGDGSANTVLNRFLTATAVIEEIKGTPKAELQARFPSVPAFSSADIAAAATFVDGKRTQVNQGVRRRSSELRGLVIDYYRRQSTDGRLRCIADDWTPPIPVNGDIVEIHHDEAVAGYPEEGRKVSFCDAIKFLFPLCPNCHRLLHAKPGGGAYSIAELRALLRRQRRAS